MEDECFGMHFMLGSRKFCQTGSIIDNFFLSFSLMRAGGGGRMIQIPLLAGHHRTASETPFLMAFLWCTDYHIPKLNAW